MTSSNATLERHGKVGVITIDNPPLNIVDAPTRKALYHVLDEAAELIETDALRCIVLTGQGERAFCAGADLNEEAELNAETVRDFLKADGELFDRLEQIAVPVIAAINGHCMGGGFELALACDLRVAAEDAKFRGAGVTMGLVVSTTRLTRLVGAAAAKEVLLTGKTFIGAEGYRLGIVTETCARPKVLQRAMELAQEIATRAPLALSRTKASVHEAIDLTFDDAIAREFDHFAELSQTRDHKDAIESFFHKETPKFQRK